VSATSGSAGARARRRDQRGAVAGLEALVFVALLLVGGSAVASGAWTTLRAQAALDAAAREYLRTYTESPDPLTAGHRGEQAARAALRGLGVDERRVRVTHPDLFAFGPCGTAEVSLELDLPRVAVPFVRTWQPSTIRVVRRELVDPHREMTWGPRHDPGRTPCGR
jgi:hypothetical protein